MKKVITYGTFDLFHKGHYNLLKRAKALGDYLIVGVTSDFFDMERGKLNVVDSLIDRIENVKKTGFADKIIIEDHEGQKIEDIQKYKIDVFTLGSDWINSYDYLKKFCEVVYLERTPDISSTMLRESKFPIIRVGIIGTGRIAPRFIAEAKYVSGINIRCAYNPNEKSASEFGKQHEIECYSGDYKKFLDLVDAVYIASPHETHYEYAKVAIVNGKHVLCEKPLALKKVQSIDLYELATSNGVVLMEGIKTSYCPGFIQMMNVAKSGIIGEIKDVEACFSRLTNSQLREMVDVNYGGAFMEFGSYTLLPIFKLLGINYETVEFDSILADNGIDLYTKIHFKYKNALAMSKTGVGVKSEGQLVIAGTNGYILAEAPWWLTKTFEVHFEDYTKVEKYTPKFMGDGLRYEISNFVSVINGYGGNIFKLTTQESVAMADIVEKFLDKRVENRKMQKEANKLSGVKIWAHRGCSYRYPENTIPAFIAACEIPGIEGIELDIQLTKDGEMVIFHDETLKRVTGHTGNVRDYTLNDIKKIAIPLMDNEKEVYTEIPTIGEVLDIVKPYCKEKGIRINIELKNGRVRYEGMEEKILKMVHDKSMEEYVIYSTFNEESVKVLKEMDKSVKVGFLHREYEQCVITGNRLKADAYHPNVDTMTTSQYKEMKAKTVRAWNDREALYGEHKPEFIYDLIKLKENGVTDFITNVPENYL